ncbi:MAG: hypothetical protein RR950_07470, partial [Clostridium sp.]
MTNPFVQSLIENLTSTPNNIIIKELLIDKNKSTKLTLVFENSMVDKDILNRDILTPLMYDFNMIFPKNCDKYDFL